MKKSVLFTLAAFLLTSLSVNTAAVASESAKKGGNAANGKVLSATCVACHGADGNSVNPAWPKLAGQGEAYLLKQLHDFRSDKRADPSMSAMAKGIKSDTDVADLAAYYAGQKAKAGAANEEKVIEGAAIYRGGVMASGVAACAACHGPTGSGNTAAKFPMIAGQHAAYPVNQLKAFKSGKRGNDTGKMMRNIALKMTDAEMEAVAEYIAGLHD
jgi:cytochrome c553